MELKKGIIISANPYKDKNLICNLLLENEIISFEVISYFNSKKGYTNDIQILNYGEFELYKGPTAYYKLKNYKIENSLYNLVYSDNDYLIAYEFLKEVISKVPPIDEFFKYSKLIQLTLEELISDKNKYISYLTLFISFYLRFTGYSIINVLEQEINIVLNDYKNEYGEIVSKNSEIYNNFLNLYEKLFKAKYLIALEFIKKCDGKLILIVFKRISLIFAQLNNIKINSLNFF